MNRFRKPLSLYKHQNLFCDITRSICLIFFFVLITSQSIYAARIVNFSTQPKLSIYLSTQYDDNIFLYSQQYLDDFQHQIRAYRFPFRTYDDVITRINLGLEIPFSMWNRKTSLNLTYRHYLYSVNTQKSYQLIQALFSNHLAKSLNIDIGYLFLPSYLIRYYRNPLGSATDYIGCIFAEHLVTSRLRYATPYKITLTPFFQYQIDDYNKIFNYYDGYALRYGINVAIRQLEFTNIYLGYMRKNSYAKGPIPDISYNENRLSLRLSPKLKTKNINISTQIIYTNRVYTTAFAFEQDPYHRDRIDTKYNVSLDLSYRIFKNTYLNLGYEYEQRRSQTPYQFDIDDIKDYNNNKYLIGIRFNPNIGANSPRINFEDISED